MIPESLRLRLLVNCLPDSGVTDHFRGADGEHRGAPWLVDHVAPPTTRASTTPVPEAGDVLMCPSCAIAAALQGPGTGNPVCALRLFPRFQRYTIVDNRRRRTWGAYPEPRSAA